jgi:methyl-accepting chemotaxis protein
MTFRTAYERLLWGSMAAIGADGSVERKMLTAVGLQFLAAAATGLLAVFTAGTAQLVGVGAMLALSCVAFFNTYLVAKRDFVAPLDALDEAAGDIAAGDFERAEIPTTDRTDEIASLIDSFDDMQSNLALASQQADALARQDFEDAALDEDLPGQFGASLAEMASSLAAHTEALEEKTAALESKRDELAAQSAALERLVDELSVATDAARDGDLTALVDVEDLDVPAEHREVVRDFNDLLRTLGETVADIQTFADEVLDASTRTADRVDEVAEHSAEVSGSVDEIAAGAAQQTDRLNEIAMEMDTLSASVQQIAASADEVAETAQSAADRGEAGREQVEETIAELRALREQSQAVADTVGSLAESVDRIDGITALIDDIAEETNMLALNASIEAARTGADGDGFAVVADEVKDLAEETREQASDISELVDDVTEQADEATDAIESVDASVQEKIENAETVLRDFEAIVDEVTDLNTAVQEISEATDQGATSTSDVVAMVDEVASVSEETAAEAETVAAATDDQTEATDDVAAQMDDLADRTADLAELLGTFDVPADAVEDAAHGAGSEPMGAAADAGATDGQTPAVSDGGEPDAFDWADD